jgi:hypothetical protein
LLAAQKGARSNHYQKARHWHVVSGLAFEHRVDRKKEQNTGQYYRKVPFVKESAAQAHQTASCQHPNS